MPGELNSPYRRDPFTGAFVPRWNEGDEIHVAELQESNGRYGFFLFENPQLRDPSSFICAVLADEYDETGTPLRENARLDAPDADEFRVDYDFDTYFGTGFVEVHASRVGQFFKVGYHGLGTPPRWLTHLRAAITADEGLAIAGGLSVGKRLSVLDEYDDEVFSVEGDEISAHGNRVQDVADADEYSDALNLGQAETLVEETAIETATEVANAIHGTQAFTASATWPRPTGVRYINVLAGSGSNSVEAIIDLDASGAPAAPFNVTIAADAVSGFGVSADEDTASLGGLAFPALVSGRTQTGAGTWGNGSQGILILRW